MNLRSRSAKVLLFWLGSYVVAGILLFFYAGIPWGPILVAGLVTLCLTVYRLKTSKE